MALPSTGIERTLAHIASSTHRVQLSHTDLRDDTARAQAFDAIIAHGNTETLLLDGRPAGSVTAPVFDCVQEQACRLAREGRLQRFVMFGALFSGPVLAKLILSMTYSKIHELRLFLHEPSLDVTNALVAALSGGLPLRIFSLALARVMADELLAPVMRLLPQIPNLHTIQLFHVSEAPSWFALAETLGTSQYLHTLFVRNTGEQHGSNINSVAIRALAHAISINKSLKSLTLNCAITVHGAYYIAQAMQMNASITSLSLNECIKPGRTTKDNTETVTAFAEMIRKNTVLQRFSLRDCSISVENCLVLLAALSDNTTLLEIDFSGIRSFGDKRVIHAIAAIITSTTTKLQVRGVVGVTLI